MDLWNHRFVYALLCKALTLIVCIGRVLAISQSTWKAKDVP